MRFLSENEQVSKLIPLKAKDPGPYKPKTGPTWIRISIPELNSSETISSHAYNVIMHIPY